MTLFHWSVSCGNLIGGVLGDYAGKIVFDLGDHDMLKQPGQIEWVDMVIVVHYLHTRSIIFNHQ